jgi:hypothetical protein
MVSTTARREAVEWLRESRKTSLRRACRVVGLSTATWRYRPRLNEANAQLVERLHTHAAARSRFGYRRRHVLIARAGTTVNHKRLYRLYRVAGLQVRRRRRKTETPPWERRSESACGRKRGPEGTAAKPRAERAASMGKIRGPMRAKLKKASR